MIFLKEFFGRKILIESKILSYENQFYKQTL